MREPPHSRLVGVQAAGPKETGQRKRTPPSPATESGPKRRRVTGGTPPCFPADVSITASCWSRQQSQHAAEGEEDDIIVIVSDDSSESEGPMNARRRRPAAGRSPIGQTKARSKGLSGGRQQQNRAFEAPGGHPAPRRRNTRLPRSRAAAAAAAALQRKSDDPYTFLGSESDSESGLKGAEGVTSVRWVPWGLPLLALLVAG